MKKDSVFLILLSYVVSIILFIFLIIGITIYYSNKDLFINIISSFLFQKVILILLILGAFFIRTLTYSQKTKTKNSNKITMKIREKIAEGNKVILDDKKYIVILKDFEIGGNSMFIDMIKYNEGEYNPLFKKVVTLHDEEIEQLDII